jgi:hypothetical protein
MLARKKASTKLQPVHAATTSPVARADEGAPTAQDLAGVEGAGVAPELRKMAVVVPVDERRRPAWRGRSRGRVQGSRQRRKKAPPEG